MGTCKVHVTAMTECFQEIHSAETVSVLWTVCLHCDLLCFASKMYASLLVA